MRTRLFTMMLGCLMLSACYKGECDDQNSVILSDYHKRVSELTAQLADGDMTYDQWVQAVNGSADNANTRANNHRTCSKYWQDIAHVQ